MERKAREEEGEALAWYAWELKGKLYDKRERGEITTEEYDKENHKINRLCYIAYGMYAC